MILMAQAMNMKVGDTTKKLVLLKLADNANDEGVAWPSYDTIAQHCETSRRTVIRKIKELAESGFIQIKNRPDKEKGNKSNLFILTLDNGQKSASAHSERVSPPLVSEDHHPSDTDDQTLVTDDHYPSDTRSPKPINRTYKKNHNKNINKKSDLDFSGFGEITPEQISEIKRIRKANAKKPLTQRVANSLAKEFRLAQQMGYTLDRCLDTWETRGWVGFEAEWLKNSAPKTQQAVQRMGASNGDYGPPDWMKNREKRA